MQGYCDVCQMKDGFRNMVLLQCRKCGVKVHGECYGATLAQKEADPYKFECLACKAKGKSVEVRDKDPFSGEYITEIQRKRPTECCLCSVKDGIHAMHPVYDAHGKRGRQIWLPPGENGRRKLAWCHTLCALVINQYTGGAIYGCTSNGFYNFEDLECLPASEPINPDLDIDQEDIDLNEVHHFVYWGHLNQKLGKALDPWGKALTDQKRDLKKCALCGKDDTKTFSVDISDGTHRRTKTAEVFQSLRVPLQCTANNDGEHNQFSCFRKADEPCYQALHVGCAMWGRNDAGEQSQARRVWFFPGIQEDPNPAYREPITAINCNLHAREIFLQNIGGADMAKKLPGPFAPIAKGKPASKQGKKAVAVISATVGSKAAVPLHMKRVARGVNDAEEMERRGTIPKVLPRKQSKNTSVGGKRKVSEKDEAGEDEHPIGRNMLGTKKKKVFHESISSEAVPLTQSQRRGRLVKMKSKQQRSGNGLAGTNGLSDSEESEDDKHHLSLTQKILDDLLLHKKQCKERKEKFKGTRIQRRFHWRSQLERKLTDDEFKTVWKNATDAMNAGNIDELKARIAAASDENDAPNSDASSELPPIPRRNSIQRQSSQRSKDSGNSGKDPTSSNTNDKEGSKQKEKAPEQSAAPGERDEASTKPPVPALEISSQLQPPALSESQSTVVHGNLTSGAKNGTAPKTGEEKGSERQKRREEHEERIQKIVEDVVTKLTPLEPQEGMDEEAEIERSNQVGLAIKATKNHWKREFGLPKEQYKALFNEALKQVLAICTWFTCTINGPSSSDPVSDPDPLLADRNNPAPAKSSAPADNDNDEVPQQLDNSHGSDHDQSVASENGRNVAKTRPAVSSRWSHLKLGRGFNKRGFVFDEWDTYEVLPADEEPPLQGE